MEIIKCPVCHTDNLKGSIFCCMCGRSFKESQKDEEQRKSNGDIPLVRKQFHTASGEKCIEVYCHDITDFREDLDIVTISAYKYAYRPAAKTVIRALAEKRGIFVQNLSQKPYMDLRESAGCWLSGEIDHAEAFDAPGYGGSVRRIGCVEMQYYESRHENHTNDILVAISAYFRLLDVASVTGIKMDTVAIPMLASGRQQLDNSLIVIPLVNEAIAFLKRNSSVKRIIFIDINYEKAKLFAETIQSSYQLAELENSYNNTESGSLKENEPYVFISYTTKGDLEDAELLCDVLKEKGIHYWFAPNDINSGSYAGKIVDAINRSTHFICLISENSMNSQHVLNEIDLAFQHLTDGIIMLPYRLDGGDAPLKGEFQYYLSRMHWNYGTPPPARQRAREFVNRVFGDI